MRRGAAISGGLHLALLALAVFGADWFRVREPAPLNLTQVDIVDGTRLDALLSTAPVVRSEGPAELAPPAPGEAVPTPEQPAADPATHADAAAAALASTAPPEPRPDEPGLRIPPPPMDIPSEAPVPTIAEIPSPDPLPEQSLEPESPPSTEPVMPLASVRPPSPSPRPPPPQAEPRAEPAPAPEPDPVAETVAQPRAPEPEPQPEATPEPAEATALAAAEPDAPESLAPREARLPVARPADLARAAPASSRPEPAPQQVAAEEPKPATDEPRRTAAAEPAGGSSRPTAPLSIGEKDALRLGIKKYYTYNGDRSDPALQVTIRVNLTERGEIDGKPAIVDEQGGTPASRTALARAGRAALIYAQNAGEFEKLPRDKYAAWSVLTVVFNTRDEVLF